MTYDTVIGLEVHLQLATETKIFCGCSTKFGQSPNSQTCPVCLGLPGALPVLNEKAFYFAVKVALALGCKIQKHIKFDRKNYFYPDLPKNFQISQYDMPLSYDGQVQIELMGAKKKRIAVKRVHLEEDAGKLIHPARCSYSLVDYNRTGMPLLEIVTDPDISSPDEAYSYLVKLKSILKYLKVSDCDMEKGSLRCDANISIRLPGETKLGSKVEVKNMNSFKGVRQALIYEVARQHDAMGDGKKIVQETRLWDLDRGVTTPMRSKEEAHDYRYFPEPDLVPFEVSESAIEKIHSELPELPDSREERFVSEHKLSAYDANVLTSDIDVADYFEETVRLFPNAKIVANWVMGDIMAQLNTRNIAIRLLGISPSGLSELLGMIEKQTISGKIAKEVLLEAIESGKRPGEIVSEKDLLQVTDSSTIEPLIKKVIEQNTKSVQDFQSGKTAALSFLVGQVMKETKGKASPALVNTLLRKYLGA